MPQRPPLKPTQRKVVSDVEGAPTQEDISSLSEQAWDSFIENKYLSENYSEDLDTEAAKKFLEFGDDYRRYIDSDGGSSFFGIPKSKPQSKSGDRPGSINDRSIQSNSHTDRGLRDRSTYTNGSFGVLGSKVTIISKDTNIKLDNSIVINEISSQTSDKVSQADPKSNVCSAKSSEVGQSSEGRIDVDRSSEGRVVDRRAVRKQRVLTLGGHDTDSDMEDLLSLLEESRAHLLVAENVISKHSVEVSSAHMVDYVSMMFVI